VPLQPLEGGDVGFRQVHHMQVIPDAGAVRGRVVIAVHREFAAYARHALGQEGHEVGRGAQREFAYFRGGMGADGVEVAQQGHAELPVGGSMAVAQKRFAGLLGEAIGRSSRLHGGVFIHGQGGCFPVDGAGGTEDEVGDAPLAEHVRELRGGPDVVREVLLRMRDALTDRLVCGKMDDPVHWPFENGRHGRRIPAVHGVELHAPSEDPFQTVQNGGLAVAEVVDDDGFIPGFNEGHDRVGADETRAACDDDA